MKNKFAAFIITYKRFDVLGETINKLLEQTLPPAKILIVDNDPECSARNIRTKFTSHNISYFSVGYNSGPAGAAKVGLKMLADEGYEWILWCDDNDPPPDVDSLEKVLQIPDLYSTGKKIGQIGVVGQRFSKLTGTINRLSDSELGGDNLIEVDTIAGGMCKIVHADVVRKNVFPSPDLFFGFEELDFDLKLKKAGFISVVRADYFLEMRKRYNKLNFKKSIIRKRKMEALWRTYYSTRNILAIFLRNKLFMAFVMVFLRKLARMPFAFKYGYNYGMLNAKFTLKGYADWIKGSYGYNEKIR